MLKWIQFHLDEGKVGDEQLLPKSVMRQMHTPYMHISGQMSSNEQSHANYGLGWSISMYRGHKLVQHSGGIDGFTTSTSFIPFDSIGVFVVNNGRSPISSFAQRYAIDLLLDLEPVDRYAKMKEQQAKAQEEQEKEQKSDQVMGTKPSHTLADYSGTYEHPAYGLVIVSFNEGKLTGKFNAFEFPLEHYHYDVFISGKTRGFGEQKVSFFTNDQGDIDRLHIKLEPAVDNIVFIRRPPEELSEGKYLQQFVGKYEIEGTIIIVELKGNNVLTASVPGQPIYTLVPYKMYEFNLKELQGYSFEFVIDNNKVIELLSKQPDGIYSFKRIE